MRPVHRFTTVVGALFPLILPLSAAADTADKIWIGGPILTMNDDAMRADAVAVKDGKIIAVGKKDDVLATKGDKTDVINLGGKALCRHLPRTCWLRPTAKSPTLPAFSRP